MLDDYINSINTSEKYRIYDNPLADRVFGMDIYKYLHKYFDLLMSDKINYDIRPLHILYEHKKCMVLRLKYMYNNNYINNIQYIYDKCKDVEMKSIVVRNLQLNYFITKEKKYIYKIKNKLFEIEQNEMSALNCLKDKISTNMTFSRL
jgi:hypothetical protein